MEILNDATFRTKNVKEIKSGIIFIRSTLKKLKKITLHQGKQKIDKKVKLSR